jgi:predicted RNase H-like HicB family nuclease
MKQTKHIILDIEKLPEGYYLATSKDVQGLVAQDKTIEGVVEIAKDLAKKLLVAQNKNKKLKQKQNERVIYPIALTV